MKFYVLEPIGGIRFGTIWAYADPLKPVFLGEAQKCPVCGQAISLLEWLPPHRIKLSSAKSEKWGDFLWGAFSEFLVSERFREAIVKNHLAGIERFYPAAEIVRVGTRKTGDLPLGLPTYYLVQIAWNGGNLDDQASGVVRKPQRVPCEFDRGAVKSYDRIFLEPSSWGGSDIFEARGLPGVIIVSERFREIIGKYALRNAWLIPVEKYAYEEVKGWYVRE